MHTAGLRRVGVSLKFRGWVEELKTREVIFREIVSAEGEVCGRGAHVEGHGFTMLMFLSRAVVKKGKSARNE